MADTAPILLRSGRYYDLLSPETSEITIEDIAHALAHIGRFTGHTSRFYSVAEHSLWVSRLVPPAQRLAALLHDAAEAVLGDVSQPLKRLLPDYRAIEQRVEAAILGQFGLALPLHPVIKSADTLMLAAEAAQLMPPHDDEWEILRGVPLLPINFTVRPPEEVAQAFMQRYREVSEITERKPRTWSQGPVDKMGGTLDNRCVSIGLRGKNDRADTSDQERTKNISSFDTDEKALAYAARGALNDLGYLVWTGENDAPDDVRETDLHNACLIDAAANMLAALQELMPTGVCLTNPNIGDDMVIPCDVQIGALRRAAEAIAKATGAPC